MKRFLRAFGKWLLPLFVATAVSVLLSVFVWTPLIADKDTALIISASVGFVLGLPAGSLGVMWALEEYDCW